MITQYTFSTKAQADRLAWIAKNFDIFAGRLGVFTSEGKAMDGKEPSFTLNISGKPGAVKEFGIFARGFNNGIRFAESTHNLSVEV